MSNSLTNWKSGDTITAVHLQEVVQYLKKTSPVTPAGRRPYETGAGGTIIGDTSSGWTGRWFWAKIAATGPNGEVDFITPRYWVTAEYLYRTGDESLSPNFQDDESAFSSSANGNYVKTITAYNTAEFLNNSHVLPAGFVVQVHQYIERGSQGDVTNAVERWLFYTTDVGQPQYQAQVLTGVAQNQRGWRFPTAHSYL